MVVPTSTAWRWESSMGGRRRPFSDVLCRQFAPFSRVYGRVHVDRHGVNTRLYIKKERDVYNEAAGFRPAPRV